MRTVRTIFIALPLLASASAFGATAATEPIGFTRQTLQPGAQTAGVTLSRAACFSGTVVANSGTVLDLDTADTSLAGLLESGGSYYIEIVSGETSWLVGDRLDVDVDASLEGDGSEIVLAESSHNTLALPLTEGALAGCRVSLRRHLTLSQVFGPAGEGVLHTACEFAEADQVLMFDRETGGFVTYFPYCNAGGTVAEWRQVGSGGNKDDVVIAPGCGLFVRMGTSSTADLVIAGAVRTNDFVMPLETGYNFVASPFPVAGSPYQLQMTTDNGFTAAAHAADADQILVFNGSGYDTYFLHRSEATGEEAWKQSETDDEGFTTTELLTASSSVFVRKVQADPDFVASRSFSL